jgi:hypothetical protein
MSKFSFDRITNGFRYHYKGYHVDVTDDARFFTVYRDGDVVVGTLTRPSVVGGTRHWSSHLKDGTVAVAKAVGPRVAFIFLVNKDRRDQGC